MSKKRELIQEQITLALIKLREETQTLAGCPAYPPVQVLKRMRANPFHFYTVEEMTICTQLESRNVRQILQRLWTEGKISRTLSKYRNHQQYYFDAIKN